MDQEQEDQRCRDNITVRQVAFRALGRRGGAGGSRIWEPHKEACLVKS